MHDKQRFQRDESAGNVLGVSKKTNLFIADSDHCLLQLPYGCHH
jgi:hypothetical protein